MIYRNQDAARAERWREHARQEWQKEQALTEAKTNKAGQ